MKIVRLLIRWLLSVLLATVVVWISIALAYFLLKEVYLMLIMLALPLLISMPIVFAIIYDWSMKKMKNWAHGNLTRQRPA